MPNNDTMYAIIHIDWNTVIVVDTSAKAWESIKYLFNVNNAYEAGYGENGSFLKPRQNINSHGVVRIEIISREEFNKRVQAVPANDNTEE